MAKQFANNHKIKNTPPLKTSCDVSDCFAKPMKVKDFIKYYENE